VTDVWIGGERIVADRVLTTANETAIVARARLWQDRLNDLPVAPAPVHPANVDAAELAKFGSLAHHWWDPDSALFGPLHRINPLRLDWVEHIGGGLAGQAHRRCGVRHGILEAMARAARRSSESISARRRSVWPSCTSSNPARPSSTGSSRPRRSPPKRGAFDIATCMELLEHVPDPRRSSCLRGAGEAGRRGRDRDDQSPIRKAYALAILGAEYVLAMLPRAARTTPSSASPRRSRNSARRAGLDRSISRASPTIR
jgi:2-polyprenyl-6-hydroxyphenyl methylase/3-demethylubiquinone-9 3-methyltransferase